MKRLGGLLGALLTTLALLATTATAPVAAAAPERVVLDLSFDTAPNVVVVESVSRIVLTGDEKAQIRAITGELLYEIGDLGAIRSTSVFSTQVALATSTGIHVIDVMIGDVVASYDIADAQSAAIEEGVLWYSTNESIGFIRTNAPESVQVFADPVAAGSMLRAIPRRPNTVLVESADGSLTRLEADTEGIAATTSDFQFLGFDKVSSVYLLAVDESGHLVRLYMSTLLPVSGTTSPSPIAHVDQVASYDGLGTLLVRPNESSLGLVRLSSVSQVESLAFEPGRYGSSTRFASKVITIRSNDDAYRNWGGSAHKLLIVDDTYDPFPVTLTITAYAHGNPGVDFVTGSGGCTNATIRTVRWERPLQFTIPEATKCSFVKSWAGPNGSFMVDPLTQRLVPATDWSDTIYEDTELAFIDFYPSAYTDWNEFVTEQYNAVLLRDPTPVERRNALAALALDGESETLLAERLIQSDEFTTGRQAINRLYLGYFLRWPDGEGERYWTDLLAAGATIDDVANEFAGSAEFRTIYGQLDNATFVDLIYLTVMGRPGDTNGRAYWTRLLTSGAVTRGQVMARFVELSELRNELDDEIVVRSLTLGLIDQEPTLAFLQKWAGAEPRAITAELLDSSAYFDKFFYTPAPTKVPDPGTDDGEPEIDSLVGRECAEDCLSNLGR